MPLMSTPSVAARPAALAAAGGGLVIASLGAVAAARPAVTDGPGWFLVAAVAAGLLTVAILGLRTEVPDVPGARPALAVAAVGMASFALAHVYVLVDTDTAILLFSVFMVVAALGMVVAGIGIVRVRRAPARVVPLLCGVWPLTTIPAGAALGNVPHFSAIAVWGLCWVALGAVLRAGGTDRTGTAFGTARAGR